MAQNITLLGASYSDVPAVTLPKTGGGTASFTDVTDTTAAAADVAAGKYFYTASGERVQGTASGGGVGGITQDQDGYLVLDDDAPSPTPSGGLEYEEGTWTPSVDTLTGTITFANPHTTAPIMAVVVDEEEIQTAPNVATNVYVAITNYYGLLGYPLQNGSTQRYAAANGAYIAQGSTAFGGTTIYAQSESALDEWMTNTNLYPYITASRYWRSGRTYKWIAVWAPTT